MGRIAAICISEKKGTAKHAVNAAVLRERHGIEGDAHAGNWHRQVSLLSADKIAAFRPDLDYGAFGENLVVSGIDFAKLPVGTRFRSGTVLLELTQIGKECHSRCAIYETAGDCIMPREGVFARVLSGGSLQTGDELLVE